MAMLELKQGETVLFPAPYEEDKVVPLIVTTLVYTYKSGSTTRWVATRYIGQWGDKHANIEITVGGRLKDRALLTTVLNKATSSVALSG